MNSRLCHCNETLVFCHSDEGGILLEVSEMFELKKGFLVSIAEVGE